MQASLQLSAEFFGSFDNPVDSVGGAAGVPARRPAFSLRELAISRYPNLAAKLKSSGIPLKPATVLDC
jgi:hypothetical protein